MRIQKGKYVYNAHFNTTAWKASAWATTMRRWTDYFVKDFGGGPRSRKFAWVINSSKPGPVPWARVAV
jgi:hypothetical protein